MQLNPKPTALRRRLIAASCALLGAGAARAEQAGAGATETASTEWSLDSALAYYHEGGRIQAIEPIVSVRRDLADGGGLAFKLTFDSLSGSSPNGALPSAKPQTFASPSGKSLSAAPQTYTTSSGQAVIESAPVYTVAPGQLPADPRYHDQRIALGAYWETPLSRLTLAGLGSKLSYEHDFLSASLSTSISRNFNQNNTTLALAVNGEFDTLRPIGGAPVAASDYALFEKTHGAEHKNGAGAMLGLTQVMTGSWLAELNVSADRFTGYMNDPYKLLSVIDASGEVNGYLYERRPGERMRRSGYLENRVGWSRVSVALSARYMSDDWQIRSKTAELRVRWWNPDKDRYLEPTLRGYRQSAASFYTPWVSASGGAISFASADQRLSAFDAVTYGLKYAAKLDGDSELSVRFEIYRQTQIDRRDAPAALKGLDLYPGLKAFMLQVGWRY